MHIMQFSIPAVPAAGCTALTVQTVTHSRPVNATASQLGQWPCQIKLVPVNAPYFDGAKLLIAADCTAFAYANLHQEFMKGKITLIGCPKLDSIDYSEKLTQIIKNNDIKSVTIVRMEVPCCGGLEAAAKTALQNSGKFIPWQVVTISIRRRYPGLILPSRIYRCPGTVSMIQRPGIVFHMFLFIYPDSFLRFLRPVPGVFLFGNRHFPVPQLSDKHAI